MGLTAGLLFAGVLLATSTLQVRRAERNACRIPDRVPLGSRRSAIVIFGARVNPTGPSPELVARLEHGRFLFELGLADLIVVSGGIDGEIDEVAEMSLWLQAHGIPLESIVEGRPGSNTRETVTTMRRLADDSGLGRFIAVSSRYHARRIVVEARRVGVDVVVAGPIESPETLHLATRRTRLASEVAAIALYRLPPEVTARLNTAPGSWRHRLPKLFAGTEI